MPLLDRWYSEGVLILHKPAKSCLLFLHGCAAKQLSFTDASRWLDAFPKTQAMLFTQQPGDEVGHFVACCLRRDNSSREVRFASCAAAAGLCGSGILPTHEDASVIASNSLLASQPSLASMSDPVSEHASARSVSPTLFFQVEKQPTVSIGSLPATVLDSSQSSLAPAAEARLSHSPRPFKQNPLCESRVKALLCLSSPNGSPGQPSIMLLCLSSRNGWLMRKRPVQKFGKYKIRVQG